jgi:ATP-dependent DNA ligase
MDDIKFTKVTLYKRAKTKKVSVWSCWVEVENNVPVIFRESGYEDGKKTAKKKYIRKGTNKGKINENTALENAVFIAGNMVKDKIEENFVNNILDIDLPPKFLYPALAISDTKKAKYPCFVQPKLNGARAVSFRHLKDNRLLSRNRKEFAGVDHITESLFLFGSLSPDGEIYKHGLTFQQLISLMKKEYKEGENEDYKDLSSIDLEYHVYDLAIPNKTYLERKEILDNIIPDWHPIIKQVETVQVNSFDEVKKYHDKWVAEGYEGIIIRNKDEKYAFNDRNKSLIKYKEFQDEEFEIVGYEIEEYDDSLNNQMLELVIWKCKAGNETFTVRPVGSVIDRAAALKTANEQIGKMYTVRFQEKSKDSVPIFPTGLGIRDYE